MQQTHLQKYQIQKTNVEDVPKEPDSRVNTEENTESNTTENTESDASENIDEDSYVGEYNSMIQMSRILRFKRTGMEAILFKLNVSIGTVG